MRPFLASILLMLVVACNNTTNTPAPVPASVTVTVAGPGKVTSFPAGIDCGAACTQAFHKGDNVALLATASAGASFTGWSAAGCSGVLCGLALAGDTAVTATFAATTQANATLTVVTAGAGRVTSFPAGIDCGSACSKAFAAGTQIALGAVPEPGSVFKGWSVTSCSGDLCGLALSADLTVTATFAPAPVITVNVAGPGNGAVTGPGLYCYDGSDLCQASVQGGATVVLTAVPDDGYYFAGWRGACSGRGTCTLTPSDDTAVTAGFSAVTYYANSGTPSGVLATGLHGGGPKQIVAPGDPGTRGPNPNAYVFAAAPDGMAFAYSTNFTPQGTESSISAIWVIDYWLGTVKAVAPTGGATSGVFNTAQAFSPDGKSVAFFAESNAGTNLAVVQRDGTGLVPITAYTAQQSGLDTQDCHNGCIDYRLLGWSPDSGSLAFLSFASVAGEDAASVYGNVWVSRADGTQQRRLTSFDSGTMSADPLVFGTDWSPDGTQIAFVSTQAPGETRTGSNGPTTVTNVWTVDVATGALFCVTNFTGEYSIDSVIWARSGKTLVFGSTLDPRSVAQQGDAVGARNLFAIAADGTGLRPLTSAVVGGATSAAEYWHSDGTTLLYESNVNPADATSTQELGIWAVTLDPGATPAVVMHQANVYDYSPVDDDD